MSSQDDADSVFNDLREVPRKAMKKVKMGNLTYSTFGNEEAHSSNNVMLTVVFDNTTKEVVALVMKNALSFCHNAIREGHALQLLKKANKATRAPATTTRTPNRAPTPRVLLRRPPGDPAPQQCPQILAVHISIILTSPTLNPTHSLIRSFTFEGLTETVGLSHPPLTSILRTLLLLGTQRRRCDAWGERGERWGGVESEQRLRGAWVAG
mmetsp:Transcript_34232/g.109936  ORF Transcript_34232/g.109936 Transcript_34232/m.109936 type:complete len:210 (-) Transcript_34232:1114-1743(-)